MRFAALVLLAAQTLPAALTSADEQAIRALVKGYLDAREKGDLAAVEALFTAEADQLVSSGEWRRGRAKLAEGAMASTRGNQAERTIELQTIREIAPGAALADGTYIHAATPGQPRREMWSSFVLRKQAGRWKIAAIRNMLPAAPAAAAPPALPRLKLSANRRFLANERDQPFFWLGDTAWELFHRLTREEASLYLADRASKGFTVIQAVALAEFEGLTTPNAYGHLPFQNQDPLAPEEAYWQHVDWIVREANRLGLYVGLLPTWGDKWNQARGAGPVIFNPANAEKYGEWIAKRYQNAGVVWILGGDRKVESEEHKEVIRAMARGIRRGDGGVHLITFHPTGGQGSAEVFHNEDWLDFNMRQNGHQAEFTGRYDKTRLDYGRTPVKPVLDGEPIYDAHPVSFKAPELGHSTAADTRRALYWDLFSGAFGHTYGHHSIWQFWSAKFKPVNNPLVDWREALASPAALHMGHARRLIESRPFFTRIPDDSVLAPDPIPTRTPGAGRYRFAATRDEAGSYAMVYAPLGRAFRVRMDTITGPQVRAWWFDPRTGQAALIGLFPNQGEREFTPPAPGEWLDFILVLDDAARGYPPPGTVTPQESEFGESL